jgi:hypothetical protein
MANLRTRGAEFVGYCADCRPTMASPHDPSRDKQLHGLYIVQQYGPCDRHFHVQADPQIAACLKQNAGARYVDGAARPGVNLPPPADQPPAQLELHSVTLSAATLTADILYFLQVITPGLICLIELLSYCNGFIMRVFGPS